MGIKYRAFILSVMVLAMVLVVRAEVRLARVFGDGMVLQREMPVPVWGWADPGEEVRLEFAGQVKTVKAGADGKWRIRLEPLKASLTPARMTAGTVAIKDVLVGEVWFCSGQSNMEMPVGKYDKTYRGVDHFEEELAGADLPRIRFLQIPHSSEGLPVPDVNAHWLPCTPPSAYWSAAVAFFFGRRLQKELDVPVGLINCAWGGSGIVPWTPRSGLEAVGGFETELAQLDKNDKLYAGSQHPSREQWEKTIRETAATTRPVAPSAQWLERPSLPASGHKGKYPAPGGLYNAMVAPVAPFAIRGVLWYQGETNLADGTVYTRRMEALIAGWRQEWGQGPFPFYYAQIAPFTYKDWPVKNATPELLPQLWEAQRAALAIANTGMVATEDLGDLQNIHPRHKREVGERLAEMALCKTYGRSR